MWPNGFNFKGGQRIGLKRPAMEFDRKWRYYRNAINHPNRLSMDPVHTAFSPGAGKAIVAVVAVVAVVAAVAAACAALTGCSTDSHGLRQVLLGSKRQSIDTDKAHWIPYAFSDDAATICLKMPPGFRTERANRLPQSSYDDRSQRLLLDAQYDFRSRSNEDQAELQVHVSLFKLATPLSTSHPDVDALKRELGAATHGPVSGDDVAKPGLDAVNGRDWIHIDGIAGKPADNAFEAYGTLIDGSTVILVSAYYSAAIRLNQSWFESRRELLRSVRDQVVLRAP
jgi:hypothetical protein